VAREIIQISAFANNGGTGAYALCDDGSVYVFCHGYNGWERIQDVPQDIVEEKVLQHTTAQG